MSPLILSIPLISAFIGWFTNWIAIKMLFHPRLPVKVLGLTIQGIFPKRQHQFAQKLGKLVSEELLSFKDIEAKITDGSNLKQVMPIVETHIDNFLRNKLAAEMPIISMFIGDKTIEQLKSVFMKELESLFPVLMTSYMEKLKHELDLQAIVTEKVSNFSSDKLEEILQAIMSKEFRFIEVIGAILGFLIGIVQVFITWIGG
jgi:uncharacterized membrane protein YheB (UPF0754 family)